ncbi:MAG: phosphoenolpyruvate carboxykinase (ATP) [Bacteroidota bacterium]
MNRPYYVVFFIGNIKLLLFIDDFASLKKMKDNNKRFTAKEPYNQTLVVEIYKNNLSIVEESQLTKSKELNSIIVSNKEILFERVNNSYTFYCLENMELVEVEELIKIVLSKHFIQEEVLMLHASATIDTKQSRAHIFVGPSGAGKSTIAELSNYETLQDDTFCLRQKGKKFNLFSIPFRRNYEKRNVLVESLSIYRIYQSNDNYLVNLDYSSQLLYFLTSVWSFDELSVENQDANQSIIKLTKDLLKHTELKQLYFTKSNHYNDLIS